MSATLIQQEGACLYPLVASHLDPVEIPEAFDPGHVLTGTNAVVVPVTDPIRLSLVEDDTRHDDDFDVEDDDYDDEDTDDWEDDDEDVEDDEDDWDDDDEDDWDDDEDDWDDDEDDWDDDEDDDFDDDLEDTL